MEVVAVEATEAAAINYFSCSTELKVGLTEVLPTDSGSNLGRPLTM
jgi:hypothetical protein